MAITISYHGPYRIRIFKNEQGGYDLDAMEGHLLSQTLEGVAYASGVYIYVHRVGRGKLEARYVGVNTNGHLLGEAMSKKDLLSNRFLPEHGTPLVLFLKCERPKGMPDDSYKRALQNLEKYLIRYLSQKGHKLYNKKLHPRKPRFDFSLKGKSKATMTFKKLVRRKETPHL